MTKTIAIAAFFVLVGCDQPCQSGVYAGGWCIEGTAPQSFLTEVQAAADVIGHHGSDGDTLTIAPAPFECGDISPTGLCVGAVSDTGDMKVTYDPTRGLGPEPGTTALEHEICHFVVGRDDAAADRCATNAMPAIRQALGVTAQTVFVEDPEVQAVLHARMLKRAIKAAKEAGPNWQPGPPVVVRPPPA